MSLSFVSSGPTLESEVIDGLIAPNTREILNSVLRKKVDVEDILKDPTKIVNVEWTNGQNLGKLASDYLNDSFAWQLLAEINGLDPLEEIDIGKVLKVPTLAAVEEGVKRFVVNSPDAQAAISKIKGSILDLTGIGDSNTPFSNNLKECINKIVDFKFATN